MQFPSQFRMIPPVLAFPVTLYLDPPVLSLNWPCEGSDQWTAIGLLCKVATPMLIEPVVSLAWSSALRAILVAGVSLFSKIQRFLAFQRYQSVPRKTRNHGVVCWSGGGLAATFRRIHGSKGWVKKPFWRIPSFFHVSRALEQVLKRWERLYSTPGHLGQPDELVMCLKKRDKLVSNLLCDNSHTNTFEARKPPNSIPISLICILGIRL